MTSLRVEQLVAKMVRDFEPNPWSGHALTIDIIIAVVRRSFGERAARRAEKMITVH